MHTEVIKTREIKRRFKALLDLRTLKSRTGYEVFGFMEVQTGQIVKRKPSPGKQNKLFGRSWFIFGHYRRDFPPPHQRGLTWRRYSCLLLTALRG